VSSAHHVAPPDLAVIDDLNKRSQELKGLLLGAFMRSRTSRGEAIVVSKEILRFSNFHQCYKRFSQQKRHIHIAQLPASTFTLHPAFYRRRSLASQILHKVVNWHATVFFEYHLANLYLRQVVSWHATVFFEYHLANLWFNKEESRSRVLEVWRWQWLIRARMKCCRHMGYHVSQDTVLQAGCRHKIRANYVVLCLFYPSVKLPWMLGFFIRCGREQHPFCVEVKLEHTGSCILLGRRTYKDLHLGPSSACFSGCYQPPDRREGSKILVLDRRQVAHDVPS